LKCDRDALKQECRLACIACSGTQPPTHLSEEIQRARGAIAPRVSSAIGTKRKLWRDKNSWPPFERRQVLRRQQNDLLLLLVVVVYAFGYAP